MYLTYKIYCYKAHYLWQAHYQTSSVILFREFIKLNVNTEAMIKKMKLLELHTKCETVFLNT